MHNTISAQAPWSHRVETKARSKFTSRVLRGALILIGATLFFICAAALFYLSLGARRQLYLRAGIGIKFHAAHCALLLEYIFKSAANWLK
jgi:hypothetical protein